MEKVSLVERNGHIIRDNALLKEVIEGRVDGKRPRGWEMIGMLSDLKKRVYQHEEKD